MAVTGYLSDFSLTEVFQLLNSGQQTGMLSIQAFSDRDTADAETSRFHFIWLNQGRIVAAANRLDNRGLAQLLCHRHRLPKNRVERLIRRCPVDTALGTFLRGHEILEAHQLKLLFTLQTVQQICALFQISDGYFFFDRKAPLPPMEMTGLSAAPAEVLLPGLRVLRNWGGLHSRLPGIYSTFRRLGIGQPNVRINRVEWSVWNLVDEQVSVQQISEQLTLPVEEVQRVTLRLALVGLIEELPRVAVPTAIASVSGVPVTEPAQLSQSFLHNLMGFLQKRA